jgi:hypothetical protein
LPVRDAAYRLLNDAWSAWLARRLAPQFAAVERFCLFVGYPRSGHSLVGALLNAHPEVVIAHELDVAPLVLAGIGRDRLYGRIVARARWFHLRGDRSNYDYRVPGGAQGTFTRLRVIGDKRGGAVTRALASNPDLLERLRSLTGVPLRLVHVVRNPFDNVAAIARWHELSLPDAADFYFAHCDTTRELDALCQPGELLTIRHEAMLADPAATLPTLCEFVGVAAEESYVARCRAIVFPSPTGTRHKVAWPAGLVERIAERARAYPHLDGYAFDDAGACQRTKLG